MGLGEVGSRWVSWAQGGPPEPPGRGLPFEEQASSCLELERARGFAPADSGKRAAAEACRWRPALREPGPACLPAGERVGRAARRAPVFPPRLHRQAHRPVSTRASPRQKAFLGRYRAFVMPHRLPLLHAATAVLAFDPSDDGLGRFIDLFGRTLVVCIRVGELEGDAPSRTASVAR